jgi:hypothetical protein
MNMIERRLARLEERSQPGTRWERVIAASEETEEQAIDRLCAERPDIDRAATSFIVRAIIDPEACAA